MKRNMKEGFERSSEHTEADLKNFNEQTYLVCVEKQVLSLLKYRAKKVSQPMS